MTQENKETKKDNLILSGNWKNTTFWNFFISSKLPKKATATTATGLIIWNNKIVLVENKNRGWELPGGHLENGETTKEALIRELYEEAGLKSFTSIKMFGYNEIINPDIGKINKATGKLYPKYAYNVHYIVQTSEKPIGCQDGSCSNIGFFEIDNEEITYSKVRDIILIGYSFHLTKKA